MFDVVLVTLGTIVFVVLDQFQKRRMPSSYYEPLDLAYGVDTEFNTRKILFRFGFPFAVGALLAVCSFLNPQYNELKAVLAAGAAGLLGCTMLLYPAFKDADMRPEYAKPLTANIVTAYLSFVVANAILASLGARVMLGLIASMVAIVNARADFLKTVSDVWLTEVKC